MKSKVTASFVRKSFPTYHRRHFYDFIHNIIHVLLDSSGRGETIGKTRGQETCIWVMVLCHSLLVWFLGFISVICRSKKKPLCSFDDVMKQNVKSQKRKSPQKILVPLPTLPFPFLRVYSWPPDGPWLCTHLRYLKSHGRCILFSSLTITLAWALIWEEVVVMVFLMIIIIKHKTKYKQKIQKQGT